MTVDRRGFMKGAGLLGLLPFAASRAGAQADAAASTGGPAAQSDFTFENWERLRDEFSQDFTWRNFAGFLLASRPRLVEDAIQFHRAELNRNTPLYLREAYRLEAEGRAKAASYLGVTPEQISMTDNTTMGLATLYNAIRIAPDQEVLTTEHEHYSCRTSIDYRAKREGFRVRKIRLYEEPRDASVDEMVDRIRQHVTANTRVLAVTWVHSGSSIKLPASEVGKLVAELNRGRDEADRLLFCLDGVHGFGVENTTFAELGCDFFVAGTHKWMFGPSGTGIMCSKDPKLVDIGPTIPPFNFTDTEHFGPVMTPGGFHSFEHRCALGKAFEFHQAIGKERVTRRIHALNDYLKQQLEEHDGIELVTPLGTKLSAGFTFFRIPGRKADDIQDALRERKVIVSAANRDAGPVVRMAPGILNSRDEIDATLDALRAIIAESA